jgi:hypothetical protein
LDFDDQFGTFQLGLQSDGLAQQPRVFDGLRIGFAATLGRRQALEDAARALSSPRVKMRRIQPFSPQERTDFATLTTRIGFLQNALLLLGREVTTLGFHDYFWVGYVYSGLVRMRHHSNSFTALFTNLPWMIVSCIVTQREPRSI